MAPDDLDPRYPRVSQGRRMLGLLIDWLLCAAIAWGFFDGGQATPPPYVTLFIFFGQYLVFASLGGATPGHRIVGLKIVRFSDGQMPSPVQALIRTVLLVIVITAITFDQNGRGINERLSNTVLVRTR
jgi:uncharacterized RDD family membrane protein YckC